MADISLTVPAPAVTRIQNAVGYFLNLGGPASAAQVKQWLVTNLKNTVRQYEIEFAQEAIDASIVDLEEIT